MATTALQGHPVHTCGELPQLGSPAPDFTVVSLKPDLSECTLGAI